VADLIYFAGAFGRALGVTEVTGFWFPKGSTSAIRGTLCAPANEEPFVIQRVGNSKHHSTIRYTAGELEPWFGSNHAAVAAMSRADWGGGVNRAPLSRLGLLGMSANGTATHRSAWTSADALVDTFANVRDLPVERKSVIRDALRTIWCEQD